MLIGDTTQQSPATRRVDLHAKKIGVGRGRGNLCGGFTHAETNFKYSWGLSPEDAREIQRSGLPGQTPPGHAGFPSLALAGREVAAAVNETADMRRRIPDRADGRMLKSAIRVSGLGHRAGVMEPRVAKKTTGFRGDPGLVLASDALAGVVQW